MAKTTKPINISELMKEHQVTLPQLVFAGAKSTAIWDLWARRPVDRETAKGVIAAFNTLCHTIYFLEDIEVTFCSDDTPCYLHRPKITAGYVRQGYE